MRDQQQVEPHVAILICASKLDQAAATPMLVASQHLLIWHV